MDQAFSAVSPSYNYIGVSDLLCEVFVNNRAFNKTRTTRYVVQECHYNCNYTKSVPPSAKYNLEQLANPIPKIQLFRFTYCDGFFCQISIGQRQ